MADSKLAHCRALPQALTPYSHQLNYSGAARAADCPACRWLARTSDAPFGNHDADDSRYLAHALSEMGRRGGKAAAKKMTAEECTERARKAGKARQVKASAK